MMRLDESTNKSVVSTSTTTQKKRTTKKQNGGRHRHHSNKKLSSSSSVRTLQSTDDPCSAVGPPPSHGATSPAGTYAGRYGAKGTSKEIQVYRKELKKANQTMEQLRKQVGDDISKLQRKLTTSQNRAKRSESELKVARKEHHKEMMSLQKELKRATKAQERLNTDLLAAQGRSAGLEAEMHDLKKRHGHDMAGLQTSLNVSLKESRRLYQVEANLNKELSETRGRLQEVTKELEEARSASKSATPDFCFSPRSTRLLPADAAYDEDDITCNTSSGSDLSDGCRSGVDIIVARPMDGQQGQDLNTSSNITNEKEQQMTEREINQELIIQNLMKQIELLEDASVAAKKIESKVPKRQSRIWNTH
eukprot:CAMPEP_0194047772 /NCGR_PEP_ID=MMETSP0009_2-20130614/25467_1 /TAXON_ID=210454 /ORGANISM="Grammatophora oceanica, Strain CCMP 410" /LENGTH=362 /DNA_ID=CAMNT_0038693481 /DNA_START=241 /DNA_END=1329 /DNA_ORIENTATION=-